PDDGRVERLHAVLERELGTPLELARPVAPPGARERRLQPEGPQPGAERVRVPRRLTEEVGVGPQVALREPVLRGLLGAARPFEESPDGLLVRALDPELAREAPAEGVEHDP